MFKKIMLILCIVCTLLTVVNLLPVHGEEKIYDTTLRLHVLANSDSTEDQRLKLEVRDALVVRCDELLEGICRREDAEKILGASLEELCNTAHSTVKSRGYDYPVRVVLGYEDYPTREYESCAFPAGEYMSLRVLIGEGEGQNWWCVLFPPMCLSAASADAGDAFVQAGLTKEQYGIVTETQNVKYKIRFKLLEVIEETFG